MGKEKEKEKKKKNRRDITLPIKILMAFFTDIKKSPKMSMEPQRTLNRQSNPDKEQNWRYHTPSLQNTLHKAIVIKTI